VIRWHDAQIKKSSCGAVTITSDVSLSIGGRRGHPGEEISEREVEALHRASSDDAALDASLLFSTNPNQETKETTMRLKHLLGASALALAGASTAHAGGPWVHSVTGGGEDSYPGYDDEPTFVVEVDARVDADGNAEGSVAWWFMDGRPASFGSVNCMVVRDNRAYLIYTSEGGEYPGYGTPGYRVMIAFEDNGQGRNDPPDRQSFIYVGNGPVGSCDPWADYADAADPPFPVEWLHGNVQVR